MPLSGPASHYRPKGRPVTINLTDEGRELLDQIVEREAASRADVVEFLVRNCGHLVTFTEEK